MPAVGDLKALEREESQPQKRRHRVGLARVIGLTGGRLEKRFLDHVGWIDPASQSLIEPECDHPAQAVTVAGEELAPVGLVGPPGNRGIPIAGCSRFFARGGFVDVHTIKDCAWDEFRDKTNRDFSDGVQNDTRRAVLYSGQEISRRRVTNCQKSVSSLQRAAGIRAVLK
jgi:hypothetical protein